MDTIDSASQPLETSCRPQTSIPHPEGRPAGYQTWSDLLFLHWRVPADELRPLIPRELAIDTYDGSAWVGIVAFDMSNIRPWWFPPVPGVSYFRETNVRTYVRSANGTPGVWFFSLDASNALAVFIARWKWNLPYFRANMQIVRNGNSIGYRSYRPSRDDGLGRLNVQAEIGDLWNSADDSSLVGLAQPESLEYFLVERYSLFCESPNGTLYEGRVYHRPYPIKQATVTGLEESLLEPSQIQAGSDLAHAAFSDGVDVEVFPLRSLS